MKPSWEKFGIMRLCSVLVMAALMVAPASISAQKKVPYWSSINAGKARMRTGPGQQFPASWMYQRAGLPVKVLATYPNWRKIEDPDGTQGWMQANLLSDKRTAIVRDDVRPMREKPNADARIVWRAEPGVVGKISDCANGWCKFDVTGRLGYIEAAHIWGAN
jgi:SH3-like domain-containing protein